LQHGAANHFEEGLTILVVDPVGLLALPVGEVRDAGLLGHDAALPRVVSPSGAAHTSLRSLRMGRPLLRRAPTIAPSCGRPSAAALDGSPLRHPPVIPEACPLRSNDGTASRETWRGW